MGSGLHNQRGQVAILFALVFTFMFVLFAFVVDFSHLINNKMNLQIAADTAAYAGAAWQARTLNRIGQVNYHLRQDFKELAMRVNVLHTRHNRNFPRGGGFVGGGNLDARQLSYRPFVCQQAHGYRSLAGVTYSQQTNLCANADPAVGGLPPIVVPPVIAGFDAYQVALNEQLKRIRDIADTQCRAAAVDNGELVRHLGRVYTDRANFHKQQIRELESFLNDNELLSGRVGENSRHPLLKSVYESVRRNLSISNRGNNDFKIEVLLPNDNKYVELTEYDANTSFFYFDFSTKGSGCVAQPSISEPVPIVLGFEKRQEVMTYFALKVSTKPRLLFMPQKWLDAAFPTLEAFAAAKPFGSRIGPKSSTDIAAPTTDRIIRDNHINFGFRPNDSLGLMNAKIMALFDSFLPPNSIGRPDGNQNSGWPEPDRNNNRAALQLIRAPTIFDSMFYTVFPDPGSNINNDYAEPDFAEVLFPDYLEAAGPDNALINTRAPATAPYFLNLSSRNRGSGWIQVNADPGGQGAYGAYAQEQLGSHSTTGVSQLGRVSDNPNEFGFATKDQINSGWTPQGEPGRIGYSVKFVSFDGLVKSFLVRSQSGAESNLENKPTGDPNINNILH